MIKIIKYVIYAVLTLCFLIYCGETAYNRYTEKMNREFECIAFSKIYNSEALANDILDLSDTYNVTGFITIYEYGECEKETYCCTDGDTAYISRKLGVSPCSFDTITDTSYSFDYKELGEWLGTDKDRILTAFHYDENIGEPVRFKQSLSQKYDFEQLGNDSGSDPAFAIGAACIILVLLLTVYDMMSIRRDVCIQLTLGRSLFEQVVKYQLRDITVFFSTGIVLSLLLRNVTGIPLCHTEIKAYIIAVCLSNSLVFGLLYAVDICSVLKRSNESVLFLPINYTLKIISTVLLIILVSYASEFMSNIAVISKTKDQQEFFEPYSFIELSESPYWAERIDSSRSESNMYRKNDPVIQLLDEEMMDYDRYLKAMHDNTGFFLLHAFDYFYIPDNLNENSSINCVIASDDAIAYIEEQTGAALSRDTITLLLPDTYLNKDLNTIKKWIKNDLREYGTVTNVKMRSYDKADIAAFGYLDISSRTASNYKFDILSSPIIICIPDSSKYSYLHTQEFFAKADVKQALSMLDKLSIRSTAVDVCPVKIQISRYIKEKKAILLIYTLLILTVIAYSMSVLLSTVLLDIKLKQKQRAILKVLGHSFVSRHLSSYIFIIPAILLSSSAAAIWIIRLLRVSIGFYTAAAVLSILLTETAVYIVLARIDERKNTLKALKGGAL